MGFALPAAIGAKVARPEAEVWVVVGDGGFQMTMCELATIVQENLKINIAIINNGFLGMVRQWQEFFYERNYQATPLLNPGFRKGCRGLRNSECDRDSALPGRARRSIGPPARWTSADQFPGRAGRYRLSDGCGGGCFARDDPASQSNCGDRCR